MTFKVGILILEYSLYLKYYNSIKFEILKGNIEINGVSLNKECVTSVNTLDGYKLLNDEQFFTYGFDYIVVAVQNSYIRQIKNQLRRIIADNKILSIDIFGIIDFDFKEYIKLLDSKVSILSANCWGGMTYSSLHMEFLSPTINLFFETDEMFTRFVSNLEEYMEYPLEYDKDGFADDVGKYPIGRLRDIRIHFLHYKTFDDANIKWNIRKNRINYRNIVAVLRTESLESAYNFVDQCQYRKYVITPRDFGIKNQIILEQTRIINEGMSFGDSLNMVAGGKIHIYDVIKLLNGDKSFVS